VAVGGLLLVAPATLHLVDLLVVHDEPTHFVLLVNVEGEIEVHGVEGVDCATHFVH